MARRRSTNARELDSMQIDCANLGAASRCRITKDRPRRRLFEEPIDALPALGDDGTMRRNSGRFAIIVFAFLSRIGFDGKKD
jgi:hypothetical protein